MKKIIEARDIKFSYSKEHPILQGVSFDLYEGEYLVLLGHNGSGKSTLARIIRGLIDEEEYTGELKIFEQEASDAVRDSNIGMVFQNPDNQFVATTVEEDVAFGLEVRMTPLEEMKEKVAAALEEVGMAEYAKKAPENLSGGQKQRVALAGVIAMNPRLLILDEATSMLDPKGKEDIYLTLKKMREKEEGRLSILSISHDVEEALKADRIIVLDEGKIVLEGKPQEVFKDTEAIKKHHLLPPFTYRMQEALKKADINLDLKGSDLDALVEAICQR